MAIAEIPVDMVTLNQCVSKAASAYEIHPIIIKSLIAVEGGQIGTNARNTNGSYDMGVMQINTIHSKDIQKEFGFSNAELIADPCKNILAGTWILWQRIQEAPKKIWVAVGNYHSKTPWHRHNYLKKVEQAYSRLLPVFGKPEEAKAIGRTTNWGKATQLAANKTSDFPSIAELEALVAKGGGLAPSNNATPASSRRNTTKNPPRKQTSVVTINTKRKTLRFID